MDPYLSFEEQAAARWRDAINYAAHIVPLTDEEENES